MSRHISGLPGCARDIPFLALVAGGLLWGMLLGVCYSRGACFALWFRGVLRKRTSIRAFYCSNRDRIGQATARARHSSQEVSVFVEPEVVSTVCLLTFRPGGIFSTRLIPVLPRHPQKCDVTLCSAGSRRTSHLTGRARHALPRPTLLRTHRCALAAVPDLARGASLRSGIWFWSCKRSFRDCSCDACVVLPRRLTRSADRAGSVFAEFRIHFRRGRPRPRFRARLMLAGTAPQV
jgi:hypothetical protein